MSCSMYSVVAKSVAQKKRIDIRDKQMCFKRQRKMEQEQTETDIRGNSCFKNCIYIKIEPIYMELIKCNYDGKKKSGNNFTCWLA